MVKNQRAWYGVALGVVSVVAGCGRPGIDESGASGATASGASTAALTKDDLVIVDSREDLAYDAVHGRGSALAAANDFDGFVKEAAKYRKSQEAFLSGVWKLAALYVGASELKDSEPDSSWQARERILTQWVQTHPRSIEGYIAVARFYHAYAYKARGADWASKTSKDQFKQMYERLDKGTAALAASKAMRSHCPAWFAAAQRIAFLEGRSKKEFDAITDEALRLFPDYDDFHYQRARFLMARWYGNKGDWPAYAERVSNSTGRGKNSEAGDVLYAQIVWYMQNFRDKYNPDELDGIAWSRAKRGFEVLIKQPEGFAAVSPYARVAYICGDKEAAKKLFEGTLGTHVDLSAWKNKAEFLEARNWAVS